MKRYETSVDAAQLRFGVVVSRFNHLLSVRLLEGCVGELMRRGASSDDVHVTTHQYDDLSRRRLNASRQRDDVDATKHRCVTASSC